MKELAQADRLHYCPESHSCMFCALALLTRGMTESTI